MNPGGLSFLAGLGGGAANSFTRTMEESRSAKRKSEQERQKAERERQQAIEAFRRRTAEGAMSDRIGTPQQVSEGVSFLSQPEPEQAMVDEFMRGIPEGVTPHMSPMFALAARGREAARTLPQTNRDLGVRPPAAPRSGSPQFLNSFNRALAGLKKKAGKPGMAGDIRGTTSIGAQSGPEIEKAMSADLGRPLTDRETQAIMGMLAEQVGAVNPR